MRLIDADALKNAIRAESWKEDNTVKMAVDYINILIDEQPTVNPEDCREQGHFVCDLCNGESTIKQEYGSYDLEIDGENREITIWDCDMCIAVFPISYCPNCGAKMDGKENEDA